MGSPTIHAGWKLADHTIISIIIAVQFLGSLLFLITTAWYVGGNAYPYGLVLGIAYWIAGMVTAARLQKKGQSWISPPIPSPKQRIPALLWNAAFVVFAVVRGGVNGQHSPDFNGYLIMYAIFVCLYLAATSALNKTEQSEEP